MFEALHRWQGIRRSAPRIRQCQALVCSFFLPSETGERHLIASSIVVLGLALDEQIEVQSCQNRQCRACYQADKVLQKSGH